MKKYSVIILLLIWPVLLRAQQSREAFGQNRIQYEQFDWRYFSTTNFDVYFYGKNEHIARDVAVYLEDEFDRITDLVGHNPYFKAKVFLYNSINDLQQSNVGVNKKSYRVGGQTNFVKSYVEVANPGFIEGLKQNLITEVSNLILDDMLFGGSLTDMWQNTYLMSLPDWFVKGAAAYLAKGWDIEMDDKIRDLLRSGRIKKLSRLTGEQATIAGQSFWNFIAERYGRSNVNQILNLVRINRNEEKSIAYTLGLPFKQVLLEWQEYYTQMLGTVEKSYVFPDESKRLQQLKDDEVYAGLKISPDGTRLAYAINDNGKYSVYVRDLATGRTERVLKGGVKLINQKIDKQNPLINWADDHTLGVISYHKGQNVLWLYDLETHTRIASPLRRFDHVSSFDFNGNGRLAALSATRQGKTDIYLLSVRRNKIRQLTNDYFDDITPYFIPGTNTILFSSNRTNDSIVSQVHDLKAFSNNYNIFAFNLDTTRRVVARLTNTISKDFAPVAADANTVYYLSDQKGIINLFKFTVDSKIYTQITNFANNIILYDLNFEHSSGAFTMSRSLRETLYYHPTVKLRDNVFTPLTPRQAQIQAKYIAQRRLLNEAKRRSNPVQVETTTPQPQGQETPPAAADSIVVDSISFATELPAVAAKEDTITKPDTSPTGLIDTDDYVFDTEIVRKKARTESFLSNYRNVFIEDNEPEGPFPYQTRFSADNMITSWVIDPLRGFGILLETEMNDMLQNHKFYGGVMSTVNLKSGDVFAEYQYLEQRVDYRVRFDRSVWYQDYSEELRQRYSKNKFQVGALLPVSPKFRLSFEPFFLFTRYQDLNFFNLIPGPDQVATRVNNYLGFESEMVFDNTQVMGQNMLAGTRFKISYKQYESLNIKERSFSNFSMDFRHYQKIHRSLVLAGRVFYGAFMGRYKHNYLLGGMDNWLFMNEPAGSFPWYPEVSRENNNLYFLEFVTPMRGFDYNTFHGSNVLVANAELRFPVVRYFYNGPISSSFLANFQLVGFFDIGSAWTGVSPFNPDNGISIVRIEDQNFVAEVQTFKNPWLMGAGGGIRTVLLGYFIKMDLAWPVGDVDDTSSRFYFTLGHDF